MRVFYLKDRKILVWAGLSLVLLAVAAGWIHGVGGFHYVASAVASTARLTPIYEVERPDNSVAISFDATWGAERTGELLDILDRHKVKATFFLVNIWLNEYPEMAREIARRGHEIGLHSVSHPHFPTLSPQEVEMELAENAALIRQFTGKQPTLFRFPFGDYSNSTIETAKALGFIPVQWSVDSLDWKDLPAQEIVDRVLKKIHAGDIILCHNNGLNTPAAVDEILNRLTAQGLQAVPVGDLLLPPAASYLDYNGVQRLAPDTKK